MNGYFTSLLEKRVEVHTKVGAKVTGILAGFDEFYNLYLLNCEESFITFEAREPHRNELKAKSSSLSHNKRCISHLWLRGDNIALLGPEAHV